MSVLKRNKELLQTTDNSGIKQVPQYTVDLQMGEKNQKNCYYELTSEKITCLTKLN